MFSIHLFAQVNKQISEAIKESHNHLGKKLQANEYRQLQGTPEFIFTYSANGKGQASSCVVSMADH